MACPSDKRRTLGSCRVLSIIVSNSLKKTSYVIPTQQKTIVTAGMDDFWTGLTYLLVLFWFALPDAVEAAVAAYYDVDDDREHETGEWTEEDERHGGL